MVTDMLRHDRIYEYADRHVPDSEFTHNLGDKLMHILTDINALPLFQYSGLDKGFEILFALVLF